MYPVID